MPKKNTETDVLAPQLNHLINKAPIAICVLQGPNHIIELANERMLTAWGKSSEEILKKPFFECFPNFSGRGYEQIFKDIYENGTSFVTDEFVFPIKDEETGNVENEYIKFELEAIRYESGIIYGIVVVGNNITDQVKSRKKAEESEDQLKIAIESAELGTYTWESPQTALVFSDRMAQIYGYMGATNLTQEDLQKSAHPDDTKIIADAYEISKKTGMLKYESRLIWPDKSVHWVSIRSRIIFNDQTVPIKLYGTILDITPQKIVAENLEKLIANRTIILEQKNEELKRSEERYQKITEEVQDYSIILLSKDGTILNWNNGATKMKGYTAEEIVGENFKVFYLDEDQKNKLPERLIQEAAENGRAVHEGIRVKKDGNTYWVNTVITALHDEQGNIIGFSKVSRDLTERKLAEDRLKQYTEELEFQNKELQQFAYIASHDLQEPLRVIRMYSQFLDNKDLAKADAEMYSQKIQGAAIRMQNLIKSVLNYSGLTTLLEEFVLTDLNEVLESVKSDFELLITEKKALIISEPLPKIKGIPLQLHQLFSNLISNAIKFSERSPEINITSKILSENEMAVYPYLNPSQKYVELKFADNGIGFDEEYAEIIFEVFQRLHEKQEYSGTGVGLALCKKIVANHHGFISAKSKPGNGSIFYVYLPLNNKH